MAKSNHAASAELRGMQTWTSPHSWENTTSLLLDNSPLFSSMTVNFNAVGIHRRTSFYPIFCCGIEGRYSLCAGYLPVNGRYLPVNGLFFRCNQHHAIKTYLEKASIH